MNEIRIKPELLLLAVLAAIVAAVGAQRAELQRYLKVKSMD